MFCIYNRLQTGTEFAKDQSKRHTHTHERILHVKTIRPWQIAVSEILGNVIELHYEDETPANRTSLIAVQVQLAYLLQPTVTVPLYYDHVIDHITSLLLTLQENGYHTESLCEEVDRLDNMMH